MSKIIAAKTHPPEYMLHKYWSRKPHNVLSNFLTRLVPQRGTVVDPFCGSGVLLREAALLGLNVYGFDINPVAALLSSVTSNPPNKDDFAKIVNPILQEAEEEYGYLYDVRPYPARAQYLVHETVVKCGSCSKLVTFGQAVRSGSKYNCPDCNNKLRFNLENLHSTKITAIVLQRKETLSDPSLLEEQALLSSQGLSLKRTFDYPFEENRRILAFNGMKTSHLYTPRNFSILCLLADRFHSIENTIIRSAALLMLTASLAQCSRLIPYRNDLTTGGPAWTVPGFWVPPQHLETNPFVHLQARYSKFLKGLSQLSIGNIEHSVKIECKDAVKGLVDIREKQKKADLVFFDPPYGDSVPYLEFSSLWNSFLDNVPDNNLDISVSDRQPKHIAWKKYRDNLSSVIEEISRILTENGHLLITFNNNDEKAWEALLAALQANNFTCSDVVYQIPAVVSSKAQFSPDNSYISDIYSVYKVSPKAAPTYSLQPVVAALIECASSRDGLIPRNMAPRVATIAWMKNNIAVELFKERDALISSLFQPEGKSHLRLQVPIKQETPNFVGEVRKAAAAYLSSGPCDWPDLYQYVASSVLNLGIPDPDEIRKALDGCVIFNNKRCMAVTNYSLFDGQAME